MNLNSKKMLYCLLTVGLLISALPSSTHAQRNEFGVFGGGSFYMGDLNPYLPFVYTRPAFGGLYRLNFDKHVSFRANLLRGSVTANDAMLKFNKERNLSFKSSITEISGQLEVNYLPFVPGNKKTPNTPYLFGGAGLFLFNPKAELDGVWYRLQPLGTEGQGTEAHPDRNPYRLMAFAISFGAGYKMNITKQLSLGIEWGMRATSTDYLDDVSSYYPSGAALAEMNEISRLLSDRSLVNQGQNADYQRGNPSTKDWYSFAGIYVAYRIKNRLKYACPTYN